MVLSLGIEIHLVVGEADMSENLIRFDCNRSVVRVEELHWEMAVADFGYGTSNSSLSHVSCERLNFDGIQGGNVVCRIQEEGRLSNHLA